MSKLPETAEAREAWHAAVHHRVAKSRTDLATEQDTCLNQGLHCSEFTGFKLNL